MCFFKKQWWYDTCIKSRPFIKLHFVLGLSKQYRVQWTLISPDPPKSPRHGPLFFIIIIIGNICPSLDLILNRDQIAYTLGQVGRCPSLVRLIQWYLSTQGHICVAFVETKVYVDPLFETLFCENVFVLLSVVYSIIKLYCGVVKFYHETTWPMGPSWAQWWTWNFCLRGADLNGQLCMRGIYQ